MSSEGIKVAIFGAAGESAGRILSGLLESKTPIYVSFLILTYAYETISANGT